jgi:hypothetical protein
MERNMKQFLMILCAATLVVGTLGCSKKERRKGKHALDDELELIERAKELADDIEKSYKKKMKDLD